MTMEKDSRYETGLNGPLARISLLAGQGGDYNKNLTLVEGCVDAFHQGRPENIRAFLTSYVLYKVADDKTVPDSGYEHLMTRPLIRLCKLNDPNNPKIIQEALSNLPPDLKKTMLNICLREVCHDNLEDSVEDFVKAGASVDAGGGRPVYNAYKQNNINILATLHRLGANFNIPGVDVDKSVSDGLTNYKKIFDATKASASLQNAMQTIAELKETVTALTARIEKLEADKKPPVTPTIPPKQFNLD